MIGCGNHTPTYMVVGLESNRFSIYVISVPRSLTQSGLS